MAESLPPGTPELDDPLLVADLIRLLSIKGAIGRMALADFVVPVVSLGDVVQPSVELLAPSYRSVDVFSAGIFVAAAVNTIHADTGALAIGTYDVQFYVTPGSQAQAIDWSMEHRDAANAANLAVWNNTDSGTQGRTFWKMTLGYELGTDERLRIKNDTVVGAGGRTYAVIFARLRA